MSVGPYLVPFLTYSALNNGVSLKSGFGVVQDHLNGTIRKAWVRFPIRLS